MSTPLITWGCIVGLFVIILVVNFYHAVKFCSKEKGRIIDFMNEREEFFVPGDPNPRKIGDIDLDEFDDL